MAKYSFEEGVLQAMATGEIDNAESLLEAGMGYDLESSPLVDVQGVPVGVASLFDGLAGYAGPATQRHFAQFLEIVVAPRALLKGQVRPGDILLERALGEGGLAFAELVIRSDIEGLEDTHLDAGPESENDAGVYSHKFRRRRRRPLHGRLGHNRLIVRSRGKRRFLVDTDEEFLGLPDSDEESNSDEQAPLAPMLVPEHDPVPFAPEPPASSYWPIITSHPRGREVNYRTVNNSMVGSRSGPKGRQFLASRSRGSRYHVGIDLFANFGDPVVATQDGTVVSFYGFCCGETKTTYALLIEHANLVINYGEVTPDSLSRNGLSRGSQVRAGQIIGFVGRNPGGSSMIHFETYTPGTKRNFSWKKGKERPSNLLNPTSYLLKLQEIGMAGQNNGIGVPQAITPQGPVQSVLSNLGSTATLVRDALRNGFWSLAMRLAIAGGQRDENKLTNMVFFARHPEREGRRLDTDEKDFSKLRQEWLAIRSNIVRPVLSGSTADWNLEQYIGKGRLTESDEVDRAPGEMQKFQLDQGLTVDGVADPVPLAATQSALEASPEKEFRSANFQGDPVLHDVLNGRKFLRIGSRGEAVQKVQQGLLQLGYKLPRFGADGKFGSETKAAVRQFQTDQRRTDSAMRIDGIVGSQTMEKLDLAISTVAPGVGTFRLRKNVNALTTVERIAFTRAIQELKRRRIYHLFVQDHANSMPTAHRQPAFLPWHRQFILNFESELRAIDASISLPYWAWTNDPGRDSTGLVTWNAAMVALVGGNGTGSNNSVVTGPFAGWTVVDSSGADTSQPLQRAFGRASWARNLPTQTEVTAALAITPYDQSPWDDASTTGGFRNELEGWAHGNSLHNVVHGWVGGAMLPGTSPNDPCFFLHHCFVDKVWSDWQVTHPSLTYVPTNAQARVGRVPAFGLNDDIRVHRVTSSSPFTIKPSDTLDNKNLKDHKGATGIQVSYI